MFAALRTAYSRLTAAVNRIADAFEAFADHVDPVNPELMQPTKRIGKSDK